MSLKPYPKYKDSGVAWLGKVPDGWGLRRLGFYFDERREKVSDKDFAALSVTKNGIVPQLETAAKTDDGDNRKKVCAGDFVINSRSDRKGSAGLSKLHGSVSLINTVLTPRPEIQPDYANFLLRSQSFQEEFYRYGKGIVADLWSTNYSEMRNILIPVPDINEQTAIVAFLDRETGKIDTLIAEQEKLIALLAEKRQATISHAVTKGLNPDAPMKDTGVEWLGDVPQHWEIRPLKYFTQFQGGGTPSRDNPSFWNGDIPWISPKDMKVEEICASEEYITDKGLSGSTASIVETGAILCVVRSGILKHTIPIAVNTVPVALNQDMKALTFPSQKCLPSFFLRWVQGLNRQLLDIWSKQGATVESLEYEYMSNTRVALPPVTEQTAITALLDLKVKKIDTLTTEANRVIDLLKERRTALISAAVTGKIDVRPSAEIIPFPIEKRLARGLIGVGIIEGYAAANVYAGRTILQKTAYLCETFLGVSEVAGVYLREKRGPLDREMIEDMEQQAHQLAGIITEQPKGTGGIVTYRKSQHLGSKDTELKAMLGEERYEAFKKLIRLLAPLDTHAIEGVTTLFAVWNDFLIEKEGHSEDDIIDGDIIDGVLNHWHPEKAEEFTADELSMRLEWMRRYDLIPQGRGPKTETGRLFV